MLEEKDKGRLIKNLIILCELNGVDESLIDFKYEIDSKLSYDENYNILKENYNLKEKKEMEHYVESIEEQQNHEKWNVNKKDGLRVFEKINPLCVSIIGSRDSGKTALAHKVCDRLRTVTKRPIYTFRYPQPHLLQKIGYRNLKALMNLEKMSNIILWLDEPQITLEKSEKKNNDILMKILSICRQRNITLIISTSDTRWINRGLESYVDISIVKDIDFEMIKNGSRNKYIIKQYALLDPQAFSLEKNEYLMYYRKDEEFQGKFDIDLPKYWNDNYSKPHNCEQNCDKEKKQTANNKNPPKNPQR